MPCRIQSVISIIANIALGIILMGPLAHGGLALSTSLASMLNLGLLVRALKIKLGSLGLRSIAESACKSVLCAAIMGIIIKIVSIFMIPSADGSLHRLFLGLMGTIITGFFLYGFFSFLIKSPELEKVWGVIVKGIRKS
jgi:putative peptidoglycan lipid II flippase